MLKIPPIANLQPVSANFLGVYRKSSQDMLIRLLTKIFSVKPRTRIPSNLGSGKSFEEKYNEEGVFSYWEDGFLIDNGVSSLKITWESISGINVFKKDMVTIDRIEMELIIDSQRVMLSEDLPGWYQFVLKTKAVFPTIPQDWDLEIINPTFDRSWRSIYKKN